MFKFIMNKYFLIGKTVILLSFLLCPHTFSSEKREMPQWQGIEKTEAQKKADVNFIKKALKLAKGNHDLVAHRAVQLGWEAVEGGNLEEALKRFNQAWLLNPQRGDIYWGFAIVTGIRGDDLVQVEKWFKKVESIVGSDSRLYSDWGRILEQRKKPHSAIPYFIKSIELDPNNPEPYVGMIRASQQIGDHVTAEKYIRLYKALKK